tara:strand:- start:39 stop:995 length:957 start_codon:yes stop_codon:yes gene_type:complete
MLEVLYCFDQNYNKQAFTSIYSLLEKSSEQLNINIIHKIYNDKSFLPNKILKHKNLNKIRVFKFKNNEYMFPNIEGTHVSEATYYRIFLEDYLPEGIQSVVYLDADIVCVNDPLKGLKTEIQNLRNTQYLIACKTEHLKPDNKELFQRLKLKKNKYFNAGFMIIDLNKWKEYSTKERLLEKLDKEYKNLEFWDQDLLNIYFDGEFLDLDEKFNCVIDLAFYEYNNYLLTTEEIVLSKYFIHYAGSHKPWNINGILCNLSEIYQQNYRNLTEVDYHISHKMKRLSLYYFIKSIINLSFFKTAHPASLLKLFIQSLLIKK